MTVSVGIDCGVAGWRGGGGVSGAQALIARMTVPPDPTRAALITSTYDAMAGATYWPKLDGVGLLAAHDAQAGRLDWKDAARNLVVTGTPVFTVDRGYVGALSSNLSPSFVPSAAGGNYALNSATLGFFGTLAGLGGVAQNCMAIGATEGVGTTAYLVPKNASNNFNARVNDATGISFANLVSAALFSIRRSASNARQLDINGVPVAANAQASTSIQAGNLYLLYGAAAVTNLRCGAWFYGGYLTDAELLSLYTTMNSYLVAVGAI